MKNPNMETKSKKVVSETIPSEDQLFLLYFITGIYFGPDVCGEMPQSSILQRIYEGLPQYASDQLAGTEMKFEEIEQIYYHVLRNADQSVTVKLSLLHQFFEGKLSHAIYGNFLDLFPLKLHPHSWSKNVLQTVKDVVFIENPEVFYIKPEDLERFKRLTKLENFALNRNDARIYRSTIGEGLYNVPVLEAGVNEKNLDLPKTCRKKRRVSDSFQHALVVEPITSIAYNGMPIRCTFKSPCENPAMIYLPSQPDKNELENILAATKSGVVLTGSAAKGQLGPAIGHMDILENEDSYIFRVSLPGVSKDEKHLSCVVDARGKVVIEGVTVTGEKRVHRHNQVFEMLTQNLCPAGEFSITFHLPGPVDEFQFSGNYQSNGIFEGKVKKLKT